MRVMGLDYGTKTVGVAISDPLGLTAQGIETIQRKEENKLRRTCARIEELIKKYQVEKIVLGFPKHMNNSLPAGSSYRTGSDHVGRETYDSSGRADTDREWCEKRKQKAICR